MPEQATQTVKESPWFARYAWFVLGFNILVILWGVFLRASHSGDGCGQHWLTCHGEVIPSAPELATVIEFSHRIMSAADGLIVLILLIWAFFRYGKGDAIRKLALASFIFIIIEALIGAGLVLTGNTAGANTPTRPLWMAGHLLSTFILLAVLTLTAWYASGAKRFSFDVPFRYLALLGFVAAMLLLTGMTGSIAALSSMLFPSENLFQGMLKDFSQGSHILLRLRVLHPLFALLAGLLLAFLADSLKQKAKSERNVRRWANWILITVGLQLLLGVLTLVTLAPIVMQLAHLLLADLLWIFFVLFSASFLAFVAENNSNHRVKTTKAETLV
jgi:heme A synthase